MAEPVNASALIFNDDGEYLLHLRDHLPGIIREPGAWSLLGGGREPGDRTLEATVRRELTEEAGLDLPELEPFAVAEASGSDDRTVHVQVFAGRWNGDAAALSLTEGVMLHWFRPDQVSRLRASPVTLELVRRHAAQRGLVSPGVPAAAEDRQAAAQRLPPSGEPPIASNGAVFHVVGVHLYLEDEQGRVLLGLRHPGVAYAGSTWHFLAGHCEQESAVACLIREAEEEAGLTIAPDDVELAHLVHLVDEPGGQPRLGLVFRARRWKGEPELREPERCTAWQWWHPDGLPERLVPYTRVAIEGIRAGRLFTQMGWP